MFNLRLPCVEVGFSCVTLCSVAFRLSFVALSLRLLDFGVRVFALNFRFVCV